MSQYQQLLLLARDADLTSPAAQRATALANATAAGLHVLGLFEPHGLRHWQQEKDAQRQIAGQFGQYRERLMANVAALHIGEACASGQAVLCEDPVKDALECLGQRRPDMVITDIQQISVLTRAFGAPFDKQLMQASPVPVHLVPPGAAPLPRVVLAAIDTSLPDQGSEFNRRIIRAAMAMALQCDAQLHLLCAYDLAPLFVADANAASDWVDELITTLREPYDELADAYGVAPECRHFVQGSPVAVITDRVRELAVDVVVMGIVQPKGLGKLLGDTTERIVNSALCSVLAISRQP